MAQAKSSKESAIIDFSRKTIHRIHRFKIMVFKNRGCIRSKKIGVDLEIDYCLAFKSFLFIFYFDHKLSQKILKIAI